MRHRSRRVPAPQPLLLASNSARCVAALASVPAARSQSGARSGVRGGARWRRREPLDVDRGRAGWLGERARSSPPRIRREERRAPRARAAARRGARTSRRARHLRRGRRPGSGAVLVAAPHAGVEVRVEPLEREQLPEERRASTSGDGARPPACASAPTSIRYSAGVRLALLARPGRRPRASTPRG